MRHHQNRRPDLRQVAEHCLKSDIANDTGSLFLSPVTHGPSLNFQQIIATLNHYWGNQGCIILQPYDMEVGAGTFHPATFLGAIGPEPTRAAYVQPSRRPTDGRYGDNPNRLQHYFQYQVVLKPSPADFQELYLGSLRALGIDPLLDDIRFVEDDWESPTLGAWGLGWEVWLNGMEITQVTYFQQVGGLECRPVTGEITYGLERIAMYVQEVDGVFDLSWNAEVSYGDLYLQNEFEQSRYNFETADTESLFQQFEACEDACHSLTEMDLPLPAYEQVLRASHVFNLLDARRTIGVTERAVYIGRVRALARSVAQSYFKSRETKNFPRLRKTASAAPNGRPPVVHSTTEPPIQAPLLLELGTEELPPQAVSALGKALDHELKSALSQSGLIDSPEVTSQWYATPRRIAVHVDGVRSRREDAEKIRRGPALDRAFEADGTPTKAAAGFARSCGVAVQELATVKTESGEFLAFRFRERGKIALELIPQCVQTALTRLPIPKRMRWGDYSHEFIRPVHWIVLLHGRQVIPCTVLAVESGSQTLGHRFLGAHSIALEDAESYADALLREGHVMVDRVMRRQSIRRQIEALEQRSQVTAMRDEELLDEVADLVEWPYVFCGEFDDGFLQLPPEVLISSMRRHQKYFPVHNGDGALLAKFFGVANIEPADDSKARRIVVGNERVLRARLSDAQFFYQQDCRSTLENKLPALEHLVFHRKLGSYASKTERIEKLAVWIAGMVGADGEAVACAARLAKADLVSEMVGEFPDLQGIMGRYYAQRDGFAEPICRAIQEHYMPITAGGQLPMEDGGMIVAIADRVDSLVGLTSAGEAAKGDRDPFSLRRMALAVLSIMIERRINLNLLEILQMAAQIYRDQTAASARGSAAVPTHADLKRLHEFMLERLRHYYLEQNIAADEFNAVHELKPARPLDFDRRLRAVRQFRQFKEYADLIAANKRIRNILNRADRSEGFKITPEKFTEEAEAVLFDQASALAHQIEPLIEASRHDDILCELAVLRDPIDRFFDTVMVMDENLELRQNRMALVGFVYELFREVADLSKLQPKKAQS